jgi:hypothetical protein
LSTDSQLIDRYVDAADPVADILNDPALATILGDFELAAGSAVGGAGGPGSAGIRVGMRPGSRGVSHNVLAPPYSFVKPITSQTELEACAAESAIIEATAPKYGSPQWRRMRGLEKEIARYEREIYMSETER